MNVCRVELEVIQTMRDMYQHEMNCQIIHDSIHARPGWTHEYLISECDSAVGYASVAVAGPWRETPTVYEYYLLPTFRSRLFDCFIQLIEASRATAVETQSNDPLLTAMLHTFAPAVTSESILFCDHATTSYAPPDAAFRRATPDDASQIAKHELDPDAGWLVSVRGEVAAAGDILFHYNRPYGDIYMKVGESFRRKGIGSFLVQELKRVCYEGGSIPGARCNTTNDASRQTLQKAGFVPCGHILKGTVSL